MSQKSGKRKKNGSLELKDNAFKTDKTKNAELDLIHLNFAFCISIQRCKIEYYSKLYYQLQKVSKMTKKDFMMLGKAGESHIKLETNLEIITRQREKNIEYMEFRKKNFKHEFRSTYDFLRNGIQRAYGELHGNILYVLELDPDGISRTH